MCMRDEYQQDGVGLGPSGCMSWSTFEIRCGYMTGNRQAVQRLLNDRQLEIVKCVSPLTTISGTY